MAAAVAAVQFEGWWPVVDPVVLVVGLDLAVANLDKLADPTWKSSHQAQFGDPSGVNYHHWAERWATNAVAEANGVYEGVTFGTPHLPNGKFKTIDITLSSTYEDDQLDRVTVQLAAAGLHLGHLLNKIHWQ
jgi:hypothetical protein